MMLFLRMFRHYRDAESGAVRALALDAEVRELRARLEDAHRRETEALAEARAATARVADWLARSQGMPPIFGKQPDAPVPQTDAAPAIGGDYSLGRDLVADGLDQFEADLEESLKEFASHS